MALWKVCLKGDYLAFKTILWLLAFFFHLHLADAFVQRDVQGREQSTANNHSQISALPEWGYFCGDMSVHNHSSFMHCPLGPYTNTQGKQDHD